MDDAKLARLAKRMKRRHELERKQHRAATDKARQERRKWFRNHPCSVCGVRAECEHREKGFYV